MTDKAALEGLAARVEAARDFDRTLDADIAVALKLDCRSNLPDDLEYLSPLRPGDMGQPGGYWFHCRSGKSYRSALLYTHSVDAAMTLVPEGWNWSVSSADAAGRHKASGRCAPAGERLLIESFAATPALALTAAALRALAAQGAEG